jgi:hypothetical protein
LIGVVESWGLLQLFYCSLGICGEQKAKIALHSFHVSRAEFLVI